MYHIFVISPTLSISWTDEVITYNKSVYGEGLLGPNVPVKHESQIGPSVSHVYEVTNNGPSVLKRAQLLLLWPSQTLDEKPLLYLTKGPTIEPKLECLPMENINYLDIAVSSGSVFFVLVVLIQLN